jgi:phosphomannomutase (EC 5.4.2.8)
MLANEIFKAYDIRGVVDKTLTEDTVYKVGQGLGSMAVEAGEKAIIIGRDGRLSGPRLSEKLAQGIMSTGCDVVDVGDVPTSLIYFCRVFI